MIVKTT